VRICYHSGDKERGLEVAKPWFDDSARKYIAIVMYVSKTINQIAPTNPLVSIHSKDMIRSSNYCSPNAITTSID
jgi:hypothetical protein